MILLPSFQLATQLNSQNTYENVFINELCQINLYMKMFIKYRFEGEMERWEIRAFHLLKMRKKKIR